MGKLGLLSEAQFADELAYCGSKWVLWLENAKLVLLWELTTCRIIGGVLASIMFDGWELKNVVLFKKDVVLPKRPRIQDLQVFVGVPKRFTKLTDADVNRRFF